MSSRPATSGATILQVSLATGGLALGLTAAWQLHDPWVAVGAVLLPSALAAWRGFQRLHVAFDLGGEFVLSNLQVVAGLEIHPENRRVLKVAGQS